jgi:hypothetical protein
MSSMFAHSEPPPTDRGPSAWRPRPIGSAGGSPTAEITAWHAEVDVARAAGDDPFDGDAADRIASHGTEIEAGRDVYRVRFDVIADNLAEATRIALGHWWHLHEVAHLPDWEPSTLVVEQADHLEPEEPPRLAS